MKKGQIGIGLVILGVVAIIAVIGLVLLFTRASKTQGAYLTELSIGDSYGTETFPDQGIVTPYPMPTFVRSSRGSEKPYEPQVAYPAYSTYPTAVTHGTRTPVFVVTGALPGERSGYATLDEVYGCNNDLILAGVGVPNDMYKAISVPNKGATEGAVGRYPSDSSAEPRPRKDYYGMMGGDMYVYMNSVGAEQTMPGASSEDLNRELILIKLVDGKVSTAKHDWGSTIINGVRVPVCWVSAKTFPFPQ